MAMMVGSWHRAFQTHTVSWSWAQSALGATGVDMRTKRATRTVRTAESRVVAALAEHVHEHVHHQPLSVKQDHAIPHDADLKARSGWQLGRELRR